MLNIGASFFLEFYVFYLICSHEFTTMCKNHSREVMYFTTSSFLVSHIYGSKCVSHYINNKILSINLPQYGQVS